MRFSEIFENNVIDLDSRRGTDQRKFSSSSEDNLMDDRTIAKSFRDMMMKAYEGIRPYPTTPEIKEMKKYPTASVDKIIRPRVDQFLRDSHLGRAIDKWSFNLHNDTGPDGNKTVSVQIYVFTKDNAIGFASKIEDAVGVKICDMIAKVFGSMVTKITPLALGIKMTLNQQSQAKPSVEHVILKILKSHRIAGIGFFYTDKTTSGYRTKVEAVEIPNPITLKRIENDLKTAFGPLFVKLKTDGEISHIGHRPVPTGLTNLRIWFKPELLQQYRK